ncbi:MAG: GNAT family N-acetyltransferase [Candidatus Scalindua sediminis]|nr:GNAT family N-acetyltransferase [Candidatus Scalindua sediminis]
MTNLKESEIRRIFLDEDAEQTRLMQADEKIFRDHYPEHLRWLNMALQDVVQGKRVAFGAYRSGIDEQRRLTFELVGSIILKPNHFTKIIELKNLFILQKVRNKGYGKALYQKTEDYCSKAGFVCIETEVPSSEQGTISFLHKMGFKISESYESPYKSNDYFYRMAKPLPPLYTGDIFDFTSFSKWLLATVFGFTNLRSAGQQYAYTFEFSSWVPSNKPKQEVKLGLNGVAFVKDGPAVHSELEDIFGTSKIVLGICFCREFNSFSKETCVRLRIKTFDESDVRISFQHFFAHRLMNFSREQIGGFVLNINPLIFARVRQGLQNFTLFKNGTIGRYSARGQSILLISEPSPDYPLGCVGGVGTIEEAVVDTPSVLWERFVHDHPLFEKSEFDSYVRDIEGVLAIRVSQFRLIHPIDYYVLLRDIIRENVDIAELGCCYLSQDMARRFEQIVQPVTGEHSIKYDFTLSFAGEDRAYADALAKILSMRGARLFYDKYEEADLLGKDLYQHLHFVYRDSAKFCVIFLSKDYERKLWTNHELKQAQARAFLQREEYILPIKIDDTEIPGINPTIGYVDIRSKTVEEIADLLMTKLKKTS